MDIEPSDLDELLLHYQQLVDKHGWAVIGVMPDGPEDADDEDDLEVSPGWDRLVSHVSFCYTAGLSMLSHPELVLVGIAPNIAMVILNDLGRRIRAGASFHDGQVLTDVVDGFPITFISVIDTRPLSVANLLLATEDVPVSALQVVYPNKHGVWPWVPGGEMTAEPLLGAVPDMA